MAMDELEDARTSSSPGPGDDFEFLTPGTVRHRDGWIVASRGRRHLAYRDDAAVCEIEIERGGPSTTLYPDTLRWNDDERSPSMEERQVIVPRLVAAVRAMGRDVLLENGSA